MNAPGSYTEADRRHLEMLRKRLELLKKRDVEARKATGK